MNPGGYWDYLQQNAIVEGLVDRWYLDGSLWRNRAECREAVYRMLRERAECEKRGQTAP